MQHHSLCSRSYCVLNISLTIFLYIQLVTIKHIPNAIFSTNKTCWFISIFDCICLTSSFKELLYINWLQLNDLKVSVMLYLDFLLVFCSVHTGLSIRVWKGNKNLWLESNTMCFITRNPIRKCEFMFKWFMYDSR